MENSLCGKRLFFCGRCFFRKVPIVVGAIKTDDVEHALAA